MWLIENGQDFLEGFLFNAVTGEGRALKTRCPRGNVPSRPGVAAHTRRQSSFVANTKRTKYVTHLVYVQLSAISVELVVQALQHVDDHERRGGAADGREADNVAEQHGHLVVRFRLDGLAWKIEIPAARRKARFTRIRCIGSVRLDRGNRRPIEPSAPSTRIGFVRFRSVSLFGSKVHGSN